MSHGELTNERTTLLENQSNGAQAFDGKFDPRNLSSRRRRGILAGLWLGTFLGAMNSELFLLFMMSRDNLALEDNEDLLSP
ncbi:hypothetical protein FRC14_004109 [Serendipita sp. 396]|nr:hypothetical protein FRC14_004109 [Serendipita sp. 396]KAG8829712.1 hypothetical protein FRC18_009108 [Serendipita sp. 400]